MYSKWALWWSRRAREEGGFAGPGPDFFNFTLALTLRLRKIRVKPVRVTEMRPASPPFYMRPPLVS
jgi:hypothetical protein